jgi:hypothetical protein
MTTYLYEQDLVTQKYRILVAMRHDSLENLPARAEMADDHADQGDAVARALGREKYSLYLRILSGAAMDVIFREVDARVHTGTPVDDAIAYGRTQIREALKP